MKYKLIEECGRQRYYEFDRELTKDVWGDEVERPYKIVAVSDAWTHMERLVFPVYENEGHKWMDWGEIAGNMILPGFENEEDFIYPDHEYLEALIRANTDKEA